MVTYQKVKVGYQKKTFGNFAYFDESVPYENVKINSGKVSGALLSQ